MGVIKAADLESSISASTSVVKLELRDFEAEARALLDRARQQADQILADAQTRRGETEAQAHEQGRAEGWRDGFHRGGEVGREEALARREAELRLLIESLGKAAASLEATRERVEAAAIADAVELAVAIAERVTRRLGVIDPKVLLENVRAAMKLTARNASGLRIAIHPSQGATLTETLAALQTEWPQLLRAEIVEEESIAPGGCRVHTAHGRIDADLKTQLDRIAGKLLPQSDASSCVGGGA